MYNLNNVQEILNIKATKTVTIKKFKTTKM